MLEGQLCVWYSINAPDRVTLHEIKGDIEDIERSNGRTCVIVDEGVNMVPQTREYVRVHSSHSRVMAKVFFSLVQSTRSSQVEYELDEGLISFGSCLERGQYAKAGTDPLHTEYDMLFLFKAQGSGPLGGQIPSWSQLC